MGRRLEIETDDVGRLGLEGGIIADHVVTPTGGLQTRLDPDASNAHVIEAKLGGELAGTPMRGTIGGFVMEGPIKDPGFKLSLPGGTAWPRWRR